MVWEVLKRLLVAIILVYQILASAHVRAHVYKRHVTRLSQSALAEEPHRRPGQFVT